MRIIPSECHNSVVIKLFTLKQTLDENKINFQFIRDFYKKTILFEKPTQNTIFILNDLQKLSDL